MLIGGETALLTQQLETIKGAGYETHLAWTTCDAAAAERNANRGKNNISAYYTERHHRQT